MEAEFWHQSWADGRTGWQQAKPNPRMIRAWPQLQLGEGGILVPLCGDSIDLCWIRSQGLPVVGVELSSVAIGRFFERVELQPEVRKQGEFEVYEAGGYKLIAGDFMSITPEITGPIAAAYDRAATVALPEDMRRDYAAALGQLLSPQTELLLLTLEYDPAEMAGPPHNVEAQHVQELFEQHFMIDRLFGGCDEELFAPFAERGLSAIDEVAYRLRRRAD